jgi:hypothetical protein
MKKKDLRLLQWILGISLVILIIATGVTLFYNLYDSKNILEEQKIYAHVIVGDKYGFDVNGSALKFGKIVPAVSRAKREIVLTNEYPHNVRFDISVDGVIKRFMAVSENSFVLEPGESRNIEFIVFAPKNTPLGEYDGWMIIQIRKV